LLIAFCAAEAILVPKLLLRFDLLHLKDNLAASVALLLKIMAYALDEGRKEVELTCYLEI